MIQLGYASQPMRINNDVILMYIVLSVYITVVSVYSERWRVYLHVQLIQRCLTLVCRCVSHPQRDELEVSVALIRSYRGLQAAAPGFTPHQ